MGILCTAAGFKGARFPVIIGFSVMLPDIAAGCGKCFGRDTERIRSHIGNQADAAPIMHFHAFVKLLCNHHGAPRRHVQPSGSLLLESRGDKRRRRAFLLFRPLQASDSERSRRYGSNHRIRLFPAAESMLLLTALRPEIPGSKAAFSSFQQNIQLPVFFLIKIADFILPVHNHADRSRLHTPCRKPGLDGTPEHR